MATGEKHVAMTVIERFADGLENVLSRSGGWVREPCDLAPSSPEAIVFSHSRRVGLLLLSGDELSAAMLKSDIEHITRLARPTTGPGRRSAVPWAQLILLLVYCRGVSPQMRRFLMESRSAVTPRQVVQGGFVDLRDGQAGFRRVRTPFEEELLELLAEAARETGKALVSRQTPDDAGEPLGAGGRAGGGFLGAAVVAFAVAVAWGAWRLLAVANPSVQDVRSGTPFAAASTAATSTPSAMSHKAREAASPHHAARQRGARRSQRPRL